MTKCLVNLDGWMNEWTANLIQFLLYLSYLVGIATAAAVPHA